MAEENTEEQEIKPEADKEENIKKPSKGKEVAPKGGKKKLIVIAAAVVLLLAGGGGGAYVFMFAGHGEESAKGSTKATVELALPPVLHEMQTIMADLKTDQCRSPFIKLKPVLEISESYLPQFQEAETKIIDEFHAYLRTQTRSDMVGKKGTDKLRANFIRIVNHEIAPNKVLNILFREFLLQ